MKRQERLAMPEKSGKEDLCVAGAGTGLRCGVRPPAGGHPAAVDKHSPAPVIRHERRDQEIPVLLGNCYLRFLNGACLHAMFMILQDWQSC